MNARHSRSQPIAAGHDQAAGLRRMFGAATLRVLPVVGSATLSELFARALAGERRVVVLDHDGDRIVSAFGRKPRFDLASLLWGDQQFEDVETRIGDRLSIVPAAAGLDQFLDYAHEHSLGSDSLFAGFLRLSRPFDWLVMHTRSLECAARLLGEAGEVVLVVEDDVEAIKETYRQIKAAADVVPAMQLRIVVRTASEARARQVSARLASAAERFLGLAPQYGMAMPSAMRANTQWGTRLKTALGGWQLAEFSAPAEAGASAV